MPALSRTAWVRVDAGDSQATALQQQVTIAVVQSNRLGLSPPGIRLRCGSGCRLTKYDTRRVPQGQGAEGAAAGNPKLDDRVVAQRKSDGTPVMSVAYTAASSGTVRYSLA